MVFGGKVVTSAPAAGFSDDDTKLSVTEEDGPDTVPEEGRAPTTLELTTLRRVSAPVPWPAYLVCFAELGMSLSFTHASHLCVLIPTPS